jgi:hypothetical protein
MKVKIESKCGNFTVYEFDTEEELREFKEEHRDLFRFVGSCEGKQENGKWRLVF